MFPVAKTHRCDSAASLASNIDAETVNTTRYLTNVDSVATMKVCRVCLAMNVKMYHILEHKLSVMFEQVTGVEITPEDKLPQMLCWECVARLTSANNFMEKALKTHWILMNKINSSGFVTISDIESIDKAQLKLESTLGLKVYTENDSNLYIIEESDKSDNNFCDENSEFNVKREPEFNDDINLGKQFSVEVNVTHENDPFKKEYMDQTEEKNVSDEDYNEVENEIKYQPLDIVDENISDKATECTIDKVCDISEKGAVDNNINLLQVVAGSSKNEFICDICDNIFYVKSTLIWHIKNHPDMHSCAVCSYKATQRIKLIKHMKSMHTDKNSLNCSLCGYQSNNKKSLTRHVNFKHTSKTYHNCIFCAYKTYDRTTLDRHINAVHTKTNVYYCTLCNFSTHSKNNLNNHVNSQHTKKVSYNCSHCAYKTYHQCYLSKHVNAQHTKKKIYKCSLCNYTTYYTNYLCKHVNAKHTRKISYDCSSCSFKTYHRSALTEHIKAQHNKSISYNCSLCGYRTYYKPYFIRHVNNKHAGAIEK